jgi:hypothetical protein
MMIAAPHCTPVAATGTARLGAIGTGTSDQLDAALLLVLGLAR